MNIAATTPESMRISLFGLGYVGTVTAACLADRGHRVIGVDVNADKVAAIRAGTSPVIEPRVSELIARAVQSGTLTATADAAAAIAVTDVSIVCVGTPALESGKLNLGFVSGVVEQLRDGLRERTTPHVVIFRSTMLPGCTRDICTGVLDELRVSGQVQVYFCPEFLREGTAVADFEQPSLAVVGTHDGQAPESSAPFELTGGTARVLTWESAELIKYSCNYFHAVKICFANEIGRLAKITGQDGREVMQVLCADTRLNISPQYLRPGSPFGGSCLPKDVSALRAFNREAAMNLPLLDATLASNHVHLDEIVALIVAKQQRRIGLLGLTFKAHTDDLRGSPMVAIAETLIGRGYEVRIFDPLLRLQQLTGANAHEIHRRMPHLASLLTTSAIEVVEQCDVVVVSQRCADPGLLASAARSEQSVIDLIGWDELRIPRWQYEGCCW